jgi:hypothetical protein
MNKKRIDLTNKNDANKISDLCAFLYDIGIRSSEELCKESEEILMNWCDDCDHCKDECECRDEDYGGRYMREYDDGADYED